MNTAYLRDACIAAKQAASEIGEELAQYFGKIEAETKKAPSDDRYANRHIGEIVTKLDRKAEDFLAQKLAEFDPKIGFRGEEFGVRAQKNTTWLVDPIDGTSHFVRGIPFCTTMIALIENGQVVVAVIHDFVYNDTYWAIRGQGAYKNNEKIHVSKRPLEHSLISFETRLDDPVNLALYLKLRKDASTIHTINCGFEFAMVASGKLDGRIAVNPYGQDWDFAAGSLLVSEAGGIAANIGKREYDYTNHDYLIVNPVVYRQLTEGPGAIFPIIDIE